MTIKIKRAFLIASAIAAVSPLAHGGLICSGESAAIRVDSSIPSVVTNSMTIYASPWAGFSESVTVAVDGTCLFSTTNQTETAWRWQPQTLGAHVLTCTFGTNVLTKTLEVSELDFFVQPEPNPPMAEDLNISITPKTRNFGMDMGGNAIVTTTGSGTWTAAVSEPWIMLNTTTGNVGYPVAYMVSPNTNAEPRTGYVYISGYTHVVTQDGAGADISPQDVIVEHEGGEGTINVTVQNKAWQARPNEEWLSVTPTSGVDDGGVTYQVAPYNEVATRQGTLTVAGKTFTVFQYGRRMKLDSYSATKDYEAGELPITVNALDITTWSVTPNVSWISVVDAGNGSGDDLVTIAIEENSSYRARTGTVTIGTEMFSVTQQGRSTEALEFSVSPTASTVGEDGANGRFSVTATPDLPWTATSGVNWLTVNASAATGTGNGNVVYEVSPNPKLFERTGTITVTPEVASGIAVKTHTVTQSAAQSSLSSNGYEFEAAGESCSVDVSVSDIVEWTVENTNGWITVNGPASRVGAGTVILQATANDTVDPRNGTVKIAGRDFEVSQKARGVELEYDSKLFDVDGGYETLSIHPEGNFAWTAVVSDPTWITIFQKDSGIGDGEILYIVSPYVDDGGTRTGWIAVGEKKVYITQRCYELSIEPDGTNVMWCAGTGEFDVSASSGDVWTTVATEPWITLVSGFDSGAGNGMVKFLYTENLTGDTRTGKIIVAGEAYTLKQWARKQVSITAVAEHGGHVSGGGSYDHGSQVTLTAVPDSGYSFSGWTGAVESMQNPLTVTADATKSVTAMFAPLPIAFTNVISDTNGVSLAWNDLAWATTYRIFRGTTNVQSSAKVLVEMDCGGNCTYLDGTCDFGVEYWYWIEAEGAFDVEMSNPRSGKRVVPDGYTLISYENLRGAANPNPTVYREGTPLSFLNPGAVTGYTFMGWTPSQITADMIGPQTVHAAWMANRYSISYHANGGDGEMDATRAEYDAEVVVAMNGFTYAEHSFMGWATNVAGGVIYAAGQPVTNLTADADAEIDLYAIWTVNQYTVTFDANGGTGGKTVTQDYGSALSAPIVTREGYTFAGWSPAVPTTMPAGNVTYTAQWKEPTPWITGTWEDGAWRAADRNLIRGLIPYKISNLQPHETDFDLFRLTDGSVSSSDINGYLEVNGNASISYDLGCLVTISEIRLFSAWRDSARDEICVGSIEVSSDGISWSTLNKSSVNVPSSDNCRNYAFLRADDGALAVNVRYVCINFNGWEGWYYGYAEIEILGDDASPTNGQTCLVAFNANGGSVSPTSRTVADSATVGVLPTATRNGYTFDGWFTSAKGGTKVTSATKVTGNVTYYAHWTVNQYTVTFDANGGTGGKTVTQDYGTALSAPAVTREGYTFTGWSPVVPPTMPAESLTFTAQWEENALPGGATIWYVNGSTGSDYNSGTSESAPKATIQAAIDVSSDGDTILVCPGTYSPIVTGERLITIKSMEGPAVTSIDGGNTVRCVRSYTKEWNYGSNDSKGSGVPLPDEASWKCAIIEGFLLTNGNATGETLGGGGMAYGCARNCVFSGNKTSWYGKDVDSGLLINCMFINGGAYATSWCAQYNCTLVNSGMFGGRSYNCIISGTSSTEAIRVRCFIGDPGFVDAANGDYRLAAGSPCIDAGDNSYVTGDKDLAGNARIANGTVDIGCYEYAGTPVTPIPVPTEGYTVTFDANGGVGGWSRKMEYGAVIVAPIVMRDGCIFAGWQPALLGTVPANDVTFTAQWKAVAPGPGPEPEPQPIVEEKPRLWSAAPEGAAPAAAATYEGYLYDANGNVKGTIQVKVGKPNAKTGLAAVKATVVGPDGKKKTLKAVEKGKAQIAADGPTTVALTGGEACEVVLGARGMAGTYGSYTIDGSLNVFTSKDAADKAVATGVLAKWQGAVNVAWRRVEDNAPYQTLSVSIAAKGKAKVSGTLADGTKVSAKGQLIVGESWCCVPVVYAKKGARLAFNVWLPLEMNGLAVRSTSVVGLGEGVIVGKPGKLKGGATFRIDADAFAARWGQRALPYLPDGVAVGGGAKWTLPKAGKVQLAKDGAVDASKLGENPSALKLTYKAKDGSFKGSFKVYADANGKPKATTVNVMGVLVNGTGYGAATVKGGGGVSVKIE